MKITKILYYRHAIIYNHKQNTYLLLKLNCMLSEDFCILFRDSTVTVVQSFAVYCINNIQGLYQIPSVSSDRHLFSSNLCFWILYFSGLYYLASIVIKIGFLLQSCFILHKQRIGSSLDSIGMWSSYGWTGASQALFWGVYAPSKSVPPPLKQKQKVVWLFLVEICLS